MYMTVRGLVLRVTAYKDYDGILTILTESDGKLTVKARGLRRKNSSLIAPCQLLAYGEFTLFQYRGMYTINEAHSLELFQNLRKDLNKLALGSYFAQVSDLISQEDTPSSALLSLVLNCLYGLSNTTFPEELVKAAFELRSACIAGYAPDLTVCHLCGSPRPDLFDLSHGQLVCRRCVRDGSMGIRLPVSPGVLDAMRYLCSCGAKQLFSFSLSPESAEELSHVSESYLSTQLERGFSALDFYKSLKFPASFQ